MKVSIDAFIPSQQHQVKPQSSPCFSEASTVSTVQRNNYFQLYHDESSHHNIDPFVAARNKCKVVREGVLSLLRTYFCFVSKNFGSRDYWRLSHSRLLLFNQFEVVTYSADQAEYFTHEFSLNS